MLKIKIEKTIFKLTRMLPKSIIYWIVIQFWADVTTGKYGHLEATGITIDEGLRRFQVENKMKLKRK